ncbi:MAG: PEGA domain-containing protein [Lachnospiraceae bacterium]|nr:PEGA domain-containing protein [Lachnospiraceae bacterium]
MLFNRVYGKKTAVFIIFMSVILVFASCSIKKKSHSNRNVNVTGDVQETESQAFTGVIVNVDKELGQVTVRELDYDVDTILDYNAASEIIDKYGVQITGDELQPGQIMDVIYNPGTSKVISMSIPEYVWEYQEVDEFSFDSEESAMSFAGKKYQYTDWTYFSSLDGKIQMMELNDNDVVTVRGIGIKVYSVTRTKGHGYIRLANYSYFTGGTVNVGNSIILPVTDNMLIAAGEGSYRVVLGKGGTKAVKNVTVKDGAETKVDFSEYRTEVKNAGNITFEIEPYGADLYINGSAVDYSSPVALNYGEYNIKVEMTGYTTYTGVLDVEKAESIIKIDLIDENASVSASSTSTPKPSDKADSQKDNDNVTTKKIDSDHTITVSSPEGAEVYLDNVYKGLAPCSFTKVIGSQTITLSKPGYQTKSYSVDVLDDDKNVKLGFSELAEDSG